VGIKRIDLAYVELASSENARDINRDIVLEIIRSQQPVARADLAPLLRSAAPAPSPHRRAVDRRKVVGRRRRKWPAAASRPPLHSPLAQRCHGSFLVADVRPNPGHSSPSVDLNDAFLAREAVPLVSEPARSVTKIVHCMESCAPLTAIAPFKGHRISMPGRVDPDTQRLLLAPSQVGHYDIKGAIEQQMQLQVELATAANAWPSSPNLVGPSRRHRQRPSSSRVSEGIGGAILANGQIIHQPQRPAAQFGHSPIDPTGPICGCGPARLLGVFGLLHRRPALLRRTRPKEHKHTPASPTFTTCSA